MVMQKETYDMLVRVELDAEKLARTKLVNEVEMRLMHPDGTPIIGAIVKANVMRTDRVS
jgi:hypothetical protein